MEPQTSTTQTKAKGKAQAAIIEADVSYATLAEAIRNAKVSKLPVEVYDDFLVMLEAMQEHLTARWDELERTAHELETQRAEIASKEVELARKMRAVDMLHKLDTTHIDPAHIDQREITRKPVKSWFF